MWFWWALLAVAGILILLLFAGFWPTFFGAPWVPTRRALVHQMLELAQVNSQDVVYDLGCGDGRILFAAAQQYGARAVGIEIEPLKYLWCQLRIVVLGLRGRVTVRLGNFFTHSLSDATVVICYLERSANRQLMEKFNRELTPGTRIVSNTFSFPSMKPEKEAGSLLLYRISSSKS